MTDVELVCGARAGDAEAWRMLYERYLPLAWRQAYALVSDVHAAEDITSEAMLALLRNISQLDSGSCCVSAWLYSVVRHQAAEYHRKGYRKREVLCSSDAASLNPAPVNPTLALETRETRDHVLKVMDSLPERQRTVLEWKYLDGLSVREIAERLSETERSIEAILYRARRGFRHLFELKHLRVTRQTQIDAPQET